MASRKRSSSPVLVCALPPEAIAVRLGLGRRPVADLRLCGMGPVRARKAASRLASVVPDGVPVVVLGVGGALVRGYEAGDLVVASALGRAEAPSGGVLTVVHPARPMEGASEELGQRLCEILGKEFSSTTRAPFLSAGRTARGAEREALGSSGAVICDTESAWLSRLAERRPFAVVRAIVDTPERELFSFQTVTGGITGLRRLEQIAGPVSELLASEFVP